MMKNNIPDIVIPTQLNLVPQHLTTCKNEVKLHTLSVDTASVVRLSLVFEGGSTAQTKPFAAASALSMLSEGTQDYNATQIAEQLDYYGVFFDNYTERDYCTIVVASLTKFLPQALELLESMLLRPLFLESEFEVYRAKKRQQLTIERQKPSYLVRELFAKNLFGENHSYGRFPLIEAYDTLTTNDLKEYWNTNLHAANLFAVASGDINEQELKLIEEFISKIERKENKYTLNNEKAQSLATKTQTIERESATQSCIRIGKLLFTKTNPDYVPMQLLMMVLGGYFSSRLVQNLREDKGYTYGVYSTMVSFRSEGYMAIATDVDIEHSDDAIAEIFVELERLRSELIPDEELLLAKSTITGELMRIIDGPFGISDIAIENIQSEKSADYLNEFLSQIQNITSAQLQQLAIKYLDPSDMLVAVVK